MFDKVSEKQDTYNSKKVTHSFAKVHWFKPHFEKDWFNNLHLTVLYLDFQTGGFVTFMPVSQIFIQCAVVYDKIKFNFGYDSVCVAVKLSNNFFM